MERYTVYGLEKSVLLIKISVLSMIILSINAVSIKTPAGFFGRNCQADSKFHM